MKEVAKKDINMRCKENLGSLKGRDEILKSATYLNIEGRRSQ